MKPEMFMKVVNVEAMPIPLTVSESLGYGQYSVGIHTSFLLPPDLGKLYFPSYTKKSSSSSGGGVKLLYVEVGDDVRAAEPNNPLLRASAVATR